MNSAPRGARSLFGAKSYRKLGAKRHAHQEKGHYIRWTTYTPAEVTFSDNFGMV